MFKEVLHTWARTGTSDSFKGVCYTSKWILHGFQFLLHDDYRFRCISGFGVIRAFESDVISTTFVWRNLAAFVQAVTTGHFQFVTLQLSTWQLATFNLPPCNFQHERLKLSNEKITISNIASRNFWFLCTLHPTKFIVACIKLLNVCVIKNCERP